MEKTYIHRAARFFPWYMTPANMDRLRRFSAVAEGGSRMTPLREDELIHELQGTRAIISLNGIGAEEITTAVLKAVGTVRLVAISHWWHGIHERAKAAWEAAGALVVEASRANTEAVGEWVIGAAIAGVRGMVRFNRELKHGSPWCEPRTAEGLLCESTVGLVGFGRIGQHVARLFNGLGSTVVAYDPFISPLVATVLGVQLMPLQQVISSADILSLHLPVTEQTRNCIRKEDLALMKYNAIFINSARSALYTEADLVEILRSGKIRAFIDVYDEEEPLPPDHPFRGMDNVFMTPHIAGDNMKMFERCGRQAVEYVAKWFAANP
jgi:phosphoglycerate dehydrogenase-like enzyme